MHSQQLISILVWVALLCSKRFVSDVLSVVQNTELVNQLNMLVHHSGWRFMDDIKIKKRRRKEIVDPMSEILEAISLNREPVNESNVLERHMDIWTILMCRYARIVFEYRNHINNFVWACQKEKSHFDSFQKYYKCFDLLLIKLNSSSPRFQCLTDALDFMSSIGPRSSHKYIVPAMQKLTEYTSTIRPRTLTKLSDLGITVDAVDHEMNTIGEYISEFYAKNLYWFAVDRCNVPRIKKNTTQTLSDDYIFAKTSQRIPQEMTKVQYAEHLIDEYEFEIMGKWFYDLGFFYGLDGKITIN